MYVCFGMVEDLSTPRNECRRHLAIGLEQMSVPLRGLLALNPRASWLQKEYLLAAASLAAATAAVNPPAIAAATAHLKRVRARQIALDYAQKTLLKTAKLILVQAQLKARLSVEKTPVGFLTNKALPPAFPKVAVRPNAPRPAPVYVLEDAFQEKQALVQKWQSVYSLKGPLARFLKARGSFKNVCAVTLRKEEDRWISEIIEDKFSSKHSSFFFSSSGSFP